jgi:zona occludens toxin (predicted ATPase)
VRKNVPPDRVRPGQERKTIEKLVSLGDAVEREEHADVDGTASKKTSPSVAQRSKKKKKKKKKQTKIYYVHITSEKMVYNSPAEGRNPSERITKNIKFLFSWKKMRIFFFFTFGMRKSLFFLLFNFDVVNKATGSSSSETLCDTLGEPR